MHPQDASHCSDRSTMPSSFADVDHLLRRAGFGGHTSEISALMPLDWPDAVDQVLDVSQASPPNEGAPVLDGSRGGWPEYIDLAQFWMNRAASSQTPIQERMALFWHGHLCSALAKVRKASLMYEQNLLFVNAGLGRFEDLLQQVSIQPAMLLYLDNNSNVAGSPNENFARELMELFTLGVGNYSEEDVRESARAWTGHGLRENGESYLFRPEEHDDGLKTFMGVTQNWDGPDIISHILSGPKRPQVARFLSRKIWEFFAYADPDPGLVEDLAVLYSASDLDMTALLRAVFLRPEFRSPRCRQGLVRSPIDFIVALMRRTGVDSSVTHPEWNLEPMGQRVFDPPSVAGWDQNKGWVTPSNVWGKRSCVSAVRWHLLKNTDILENDGATAQEAVDSALSLFGIYDASGATRANLRNFYDGEPQAWARRAGLLLLTPLTAEFQLA